MIFVGDSQTHKPHPSRADRDTASTTHTNYKAFGNRGILFWKQTRLSCISLSNFLSTLTGISRDSGVTDGDRYITCKLRKWVPLLQREPARTTAQKAYQKEEGSVLLHFSALLRPKFGSHTHDTKKQTKLSEQEGLGSCTIFVDAPPAYSSGMNQALITCKK